MINNSKELIKSDEVSSDFHSTVDDPLAEPRQQIKNLCTMLMVPFEEFDSKKALNLIKTYEYDRILYSEITSFVFAIESTERDNYTTNVDILLHDAYCDPALVDKQKNTVTKIYDHFHLALHQTANVETAVQSAVNGAKIELSRDVAIVREELTDGVEKVKHELNDDVQDVKKEYKKMEREYIAILGIFASIVLTFVGGLTFSSSVLQNINAVSIYRLLIVVDILAFALINAIFALVAFIAKISDAGISLKILKGINIGLGIFAIVVVLLWFFDIVAIQKFFAEIFPW